MSHPRLSRIGRVVVGTVLLLACGACYAPRLIVEDVHLERLPDDAGLRWEATILNSTARPPLSICRPGAANAVVVVEAFLAQNQNPSALERRILGRNAITDGGDPSSGLPDAIPPGGRKTTGWTEEVGDFSAYPFVIFHVYAHRPPVAVEAGWQQLENSRCTQ